MALRYHQMVLQSNEIPIHYNCAAAAASWTVLAGFFIFPGTFTSLKRSEVLAHSQGGRVVQNAVQNIPLLPLASCLYVLGITGLGLLWWKFRANYVWLLGHIFLYGQKIP